MSTTLCYVENSNSSQEKIANVFGVKFLAKNGSRINRLLVFGSMLKVFYCADWALCDE